MAQVNPLTREVLIKLVYYGPGLGGKTTSLKWLHSAAPAESRGNLVSLATPVDRTLYFDFLPLRVTPVRGHPVRLQLFTVPGQVHFDATRKLVLTGVDGVVFVADSQRDRHDANFESLQNLEVNLREQGRELSTTPHVLEYNKRDLPAVLPRADMDRDLNQHGAPAFETCATTGGGVLEALDTLVRIVLEDLEARRVFGPPQTPRPSAQLTRADDSLAEQVRRASEHDLEVPPGLTVGTQTPVPPVGAPAPVAPVVRARVTSPYARVQGQEQASDARAQSHTPEQSFPSTPAATREQDPLYSPEGSEAPTAPGAIDPAYIARVDAMQAAQKTDVPAAPFEDDIEARRPSSIPFVPAAPPVPSAPEPSERTTPVPPDAPPTGLAPTSKRPSILPRAPRPPTDRPYAVTALSFAMLAGPDQAAALAVEDRLAARDLRAALHRADELVLRVLARAGAHGGLGESARDSTTVALCLGASPERWLAFRRLTRRAREGRDIDVEEALRAYLFALDLAMRCVRALAD